MQYRHTFSVNAPIERVADFHRASASMAAITPPPILVRLHQAPEILTEGDEMRFTLWFGPLALRWLARVEKLSETGFIDKQIEGPFEHWEHEHCFQALNPDRTLVIDQVSAGVKRHWFWGLVGRVMWLNLPVLFAYRGWKTRALLSS
jgi:ligand-binding SRPBCC domain-containing protein